MFKFLQRKSAVEARILDALDTGHLGGGLGAGLSAEQALGVIAVFGARRVISEDVAKLPARLKRMTDDGSELAFSEPEHRLLSSVGKSANETDDGFTAMEWIEALVADAAFHGIGVAHLNRFGGKAREVTPIPFSNWQNNGNSWTVKARHGVWVPVDRSDLMVLRGPQLGSNVTGYARQAIDLARRLDLMMTSLAKKAGRPNGIVSSEAIASKETAATFIERIKDYFGPQSDGGLMPVDLGQLHYLRLSMTPEELQQDATYLRAVTQIACAYRVQPSRLMIAITDHNNASLYSSNATHVQDCVQPWTKRVRQTFDKDVLGSERLSQGYYCDIALQGLLQGAPEERGKLYTALRSCGAISPLTIAKLEELPTRGVSDDPREPLLTNPNPQKEKESDNAGE